MQKLKFKIIVGFAFCVLSFELPLAFAAVSDGYIVRVDSPTVYLDWGKASGVQPGDRFKIYRQGAELKHPLTGEILGHTEMSVAEGGIEHVDEKFSTGKLYQASLKPDIGDRIRYEETVSSPIVVSTAAASANLSVGIPTLTELWRSDPLPAEAVGIAVGDVDGDGHSEIVVASVDKIEVFRVTDRRAESVAVYQARLYKHWLGVEVADAMHQGHSDIFATEWQDGYHRPRVIVLRMIDGDLKQVADFGGFVRSIDRSDGTHALVLQDITNGREKSFTAPALLVPTKNSYKSGSAVPLSRLRDDQLFGFTLGDWDQDHFEDQAILQGGETLRVFLKSNKWSATESYGGTKNRFTIDTQSSIASYTPRLLAATTTQGAFQLVAPRNKLDTGIRLGHVNFYKNADITGFAWNGTEMATAWRQPLMGYVADLAIGDGLNASPPQLWVAATAPDGKTILLAYRLP